MLKYNDSEIYQMMNRGGVITDKMKEVGSAINEKIIVNTKIDTLDGFRRTYRETITNLISESIRTREILIVCPDIDKRFPANIPFLKTKINGKTVVVVDFSKYATVDKIDTGEIAKVSIDVDKLYNILVPAYLYLKLFYDTVSLPSESIKLFAIMWAKMFNKVLISRKIFVGNAEKYEAFMYFAMRFFMTYYLQTPDPVTDSISMGYIGGVKSKYIEFVEYNLASKGINLYANWSTFASAMFNNDVTNIASFNTSGIVMDAKFYLQLFDSYMGKDGGYLALWSVPYFFYTLFVTYNRGYILNDRNWEDVVLKDKQNMPKLLNSLYKEL